MNYLGILDCDIADGEGVRVGLFVAGCSHHCKGCHNPESWDETAGKPFTEETKNKLFELVDHAYIDGITISGGDPLYLNNQGPVTKLLKEFKDHFPNKTVWLYTGYLYEQVKDLPLMKYVDVLVDGEFILEQRDTTLPFRGSPNQRIIYLSKDIS